MKLKPCPFCKSENLSSGEIQGKNMENGVTLESLVGEHVLSGVDTGHCVIDDGYNRGEHASTLTFILDGVTYTCTEDPSDGYRSSMESLVVGGVVVANQFAPQRVVCSHVTNSEYGYGADLLVMRDVVTGKDVLTIGTDNVDDYYPSFIANFDPTAMACNAK